MVVDESAYMIEQPRRLRPAMEARRKRSFLFEKGSF